MSHVALKDKGSEPILFNIPFRGAIKQCGCTHVLLEIDNEPSILDLENDFL